MNTVIIVLFNNMYISHDKIYYLLSVVLINHADDVRGVHTQVILKKILLVKINLFSLRLFSQYIYLKQIQKIHIISL